MVTDLTTEWREIGAKPISLDAPAGSPVRDDADFLSMQDEIQKLESMTGEPVNWKDIVAGGRTVLGEKSKDLLAASYVCLALLHEEEFQGLAAGLACLHEMLAHYWDTFYPDAKRVQKRIDVLVWLGEKLEAAVGGKSLSPRDLEGGQTCEVLTRTLDSLLVEKLADKAPGFAGLRNVLLQHIEKLGQSEAKLQGTGKEVQRAEGQPPTSGGPRTIATVEECRGALQEAEALIRRAAAYSRTQDSSLPWPYRMVRAATWVTLQMPSPLSDGLSRIPPPAPHVVHRYQEMQEKGLWAQLLDQAESQFPDSPFWLDPHRLTVRALEQLGPSYRSAKEAVEGEMRELMNRLPDLPTCRFSDEMPFANEETRQWIEDLQKEEELESTDGRGDRRLAREDERLYEVRMQATTLVEQGQVREAIGLLQHESAGVTSERDRFLLKLEAAKQCLRVGYPTMALSQLEGLDEGIARFALDVWEPSLSVDVWRTMWQVLQQLLRDSKQPTSEWASRAETVYRRICRVDMLSAFEMESKRKSARTAR